MLVAKCVGIENEWGPVLMVRTGVKKDGGMSVRVRSGVENEWGPVLMVRAGLKKDGGMSVRLRSGVENHDIC